MPEEREELTVRVTEQQKKQLAQAMLDRGYKKTQHVLLEALDLWLTHEGGIPLRQEAPATFSDLTKEETQILCAVLEFMRDDSVSRTNPITFKPSLIELGKRFAKRRAVST